MAETKTIREWFEAYPTPLIRDKLLRNMDADAADFRVESFMEALNIGFSWTESPEKEDFWGTIWDRALAEEERETDIDASASRG